MTSPVITCPDCGATESDNTLSHLDGCPAARAVDEMTDRDREWFEAHPAATEYFREALPGDYGVVSLDAFIVEGKVHVSRQGPGMRARRLPTLLLRVDAIDGMSASAAHFLHFSSKAETMPPELAARLGLLDES